MIFVGAVMVLTIISVTHGIQLSFMIRSKVPSIPLILLITLCIVISSTVVLSIKYYPYVYLSFAVYDLLIACFLLVALLEMLTVMSHIPQLQNCEAKDTSKYFVHTFGASFLLAVVINVLKSVFYLEYIGIVQN